MIEETIIQTLSTALNMDDVYMEVPERLPTKCIVIERTGSSMSNLIETATIAVQSYDASLIEAAQLNEAAKEAMLFELPKNGDVASCKLNTDYNFTDPTTHRYRYQALFEIVHY